MKKRTQFLLVIVTTLWFSRLSLGASLKGDNLNKVYKGTAIFHVKPNKIQDFRSEVLKIIGPTRRERDCISYEAFQVLNENGLGTPKFEFHELWKSKHSMMVDHKENTKHMKHFFQTIKLDEKDSWIEKNEIFGSDVEELQ